ncbi:MAG: hypothetical protein A3A61_04290 [Candidatus Woykebacteria bacterium RIFCSPLOWO2_01_FULL_43_14]|uniref:Antitoxin n=1 Tax=Candidatus Woykebacteria bacterium RIFCSPLOWO2_01_FULL_43_14 TaxID=1802605 RepID=A0A1G1WWZ5_9BACT|nr:MAG: hypothetical protein A3A61_04290 [Candidatus Woykebacteria bacterium RIFCSPLOWO2_01_FULL_43_14]
MSFIPKLTSAAQLQRNFRKVIEEAKEDKEPVVILRHNKPEAAVVDIETFETLSQKAGLYDEITALEALKQSEEEYQLGKAKKLTSLSSLLDED